MQGRQGTGEAGGQGAGGKGENKKLALSPVPRAHAQCPMPHAPCPMLNAQCPVQQTYFN
ncbi:hypothetical protein GXM_01647 [Nostoc sphaeroides CCNUC1]|uniref:Uncharacterized protein n=1 Tax=Nostoc sphaeroides CCNUC1 TaxID=2653204 RepID=A0A5P8VUZ6_9NOSO|nr:hypothetical protein GXM_01647 [Nostoc sphaeroides CCNUC1]